MLEQILPDEAVAAVERERAFLEKVHAFAEQFDPGGESAQRVAELIEHLDDMFLLVVVGEVKAGKSAFINALLDVDACPEGPLPLTDRVHVIAYGDTASEAVMDGDITRHTLPVKSLHRMNVVDTPGTNSPLERHQEVTERFLPRADIVFFVTSIDCPLTHTEIEFLKEISGRWRKDIACILAKVDMRPESDREVVRQYLSDSFQEHLGFQPPLFSVSSKDGVGIEEVRAHIVDNLSEERRITLKLRSPLGVVLDIVASLDADAAGRAQVLEADFRGWNAIQEQVTFAATSLKERAERYVGPVGVSFENLEARGRDFLRDVIRLRNLPLISDKGRFEAEFAREVVRDAAAEIDGKVEAAARWLGGETKALWERSLAHFNETVPLDRYIDEIAAGAGPQFRETRRETLEEIVAAARRHLDGFSIESECVRIRALARSGLTRLIGVEVAAAGLGAGLAAAIVPGVGVAVGAAIALGGFLMLPARRQKAIEGFERGVRATRDALLAALREAVATEAERAAAAVLDAFTPFHDFYEGRKRSLDSLRAEARTLTDETNGLLAGLE